MKSELISINGKIILLRPLIKYDFYLNYLELINSKLSKEKAIKLYDIEKEKYFTLILYNCFEYKIAALCKFNIYDNKIENIIIKEDYVYLKDKIEKIIKDRLFVFMNKINLE